MRWPFSIFSRGSHEDPSDAPAGDGPAAGGPSDEAADLVAHGSGSTGAAAGEAGVASAAGPAWRSLPPVQRTAGPAPLTAPALPFARDLAGRNGPEPTLAPLGHAVAADGTAGLVSGVATPLVVPPAGTMIAAAGTDAGGSAGALPVAGPPGRPVAQRQAARTTVAPPPVQRDWDATGPLASADPGGLARALPVAQRVADALDATHVAPASAPDPVRVLAPVVGAAADAGRSVQRERATGVEAAGATPAASVVRGSDDLGGKSAEAAAAPEAAGATVGAGAAPAEAVAQPASSLAGPDPGDPGAGHHDASGSATRRTLGESRRLGLGAPLAGRPPVQRLGEGAASLPLALPGRTGSPAHLDAGPIPAAAAPPSLPVPAIGSTAPLRVLRSVAPDASSGPGTGAPTPLTDGGSRAPGLADALAALPLASNPARRPAEPGVVGGAGGRSAADAAADQVSGPGTAGFGDRAGGDVGTLPLAGGGVTQRLAMAMPESAEERDPATAAPAPSAALAATEEPVDLAPFGEQGSRPTDAVSGTTSDAATAATALPLAGSRPSIRRSAAASVAVLRSPVAEGSAAADGPDAAAGTPGPAVVARMATGERPFGLAAAGAPTTLSSATTFGPMPGETVRQVGTVATGGAHHATPTGPGPAPAMPVVARRRLDVSEASAPPVVSRPGHASVAGSFGPTADIPAAFATAWEASDQATSSGPASVQRAVTIDEMDVSASPAGGSTPGGGGGTSGGAGPGPTDLDELADELYPKVRDRLALDLLLDRERAGLLGDW